MDQAQIKAWIDALGIPALFVADDTRIIAANDLAISVYNLNVAGLIYSAALRQPAAIEAIHACLEYHKIQTARIHHIENGTDTVFDLRCAYIDKGLRGVLITLKDLTDEGKNTQLHRDFVANVSHELRTPLTAISGFIETLQGSAKKDEKALDRFLGMMARQSARMDRLVSDLLSLSRIEAQERQRPSDTVYLHDLLATVIESYKAQDVEIISQLNAHDHAVQADADQLHQVFSNLIENAVKYGQAGAPITVTTKNVACDARLRVPAIRMSVCDTGAGIDPIHLPRLTERFYRIDGHRSREKGGTGLGLAIAKHIISRHRGRFEIKSKISQGSEFTAIIPTR